MSASFTWPIRVYYEDTDASGVVYHARYLHWFERARSEWLRARGVSHQHLAADFGAAFTVASVEVRYRQPARLDDSLQVTVAVAQYRHASLVFEQGLYRVDSTGELLARAEIKVACVDLGSFKPRPWPAGWLEP